ncbi:MAG: HAD hydrolase-like protein [Bacilli bacterium]|jgi:phosphoglycolate phosphatase
MKKSLFFDLDGTLWNALSPLTESWNKAMEDNNLPYRFDIKAMTSYMGLTPEETVPLAFKDVPFEIGMKYFSLCLDAEIKYLAIHPGTPYPFEREVLKDLSSLYPLYIVSNSGKGYIENYLTALKMTEYFKGHLCVGDLGLVKYQNILYIKKQENFTDIIYIGDTYKDLVESRKASVSFVHASYGFGVINEKVNSISSLKELPSLVKKIFND